MMTQAMVGLVLLVLGVLLLLDQANLVDFGRTVATWWPLLIVALGLWLLFGRARLGRGGVVPETEDEGVQAVALFSGREIVSHAGHFRGGSLTALFGGIDLDLRSARLDPEGATLDAVAIFGGVEVVVPPGWRVRLEGPAVFGGNTNHTQRLAQPQPDTPLLTVRALSVFGGVEVEDRNAA